MSDLLESNVGTVLDTFKGTVTQIPYATARAINETAKQVQIGEDDNLQKKLVIRSDWWAPGRKFGINIKPWATKQTQSATIGSQADWLRLQEDGGTKVPTTAKNIAAATPEQRGGITNILRRGQRPRAMLNQAGVFVEKSRAGLLGIWQRIDTGIRLLFTLKPSVRVKKVLGFKERGEQIVKANYEGNFRKAYADAIQDFKPK
jgi:hypothetical protein